MIVWLACSLWLIIGAVIGRWAWPRRITEWQTKTEWQTFYCCSTFRVNDEFRIVVEDDRAMLQKVANCYSPPIYVTAGDITEDVKLLALSRRHSWGRMLLL